MKYACIAIGNFCFIEIGFDKKAEVVSIKRRAFQEDEYLRISKRNVGHTRRDILKG